MQVPRDIDLLDVVKILRQRLWLMATIILVSMSIASVIIVRLPKQYTAEATVVMNSRSNKIADLQSLISKPLLGVPAADTSVLRTEIETIMSPALIQRVIEEKNLLEEPEFNPLLERQQQGLLRSIYNIPMVQQAVTAVARAIADMKATLSTGASEQDEHSAPLDPLPLTMLRVQDALSVTTDGVSYVLTIRFKAHSARLAAEVANAFADIYLRDQENVKLATTRNAASWLGTRIQDLEGDVLKSEREFLNFREQNGLAEENGSTLLDHQIAQVNSLLITASADRSQRRGRHQGASEVAEEPGCHRWRKPCPVVAAYSSTAR